MSFFFANLEQAAKPLSRQQRNTESLHRLGCVACPLNKAKVQTPKMQPTLADKTLIYFLGEAPGYQEDKKGKPFVGPSGSLLRSVIPEDLIDYCSFDNVINCRPSTDNRNPEPVEIDCCHHRRIKYIEETKPRLIIGLGAFAQQWMLKSSDQRGMRGRLFAVKIGNHSCWFMPTYHPARIIHSANEQVKGQKKKDLNNAELLRTYFGRTFKLDLEKAFKLVEKLVTPVIDTEADIRQRIITFDGVSSRGTGIPCKEPALGSTPSHSTTLNGQDRWFGVRDEGSKPSLSTTFNGLAESYKGPHDGDVGVSAPSSPPTLFELLTKAKKAPVKSIDLETSHLRPYAKGAKILSCAISFNSTNFSFAIDHPKAGWTKEQRKQILELLESILTDDTIKVAHNVPFELEWLIHYFGKNVVNHCAWECTQLQAHFLDERRGAGQSDDDSRRATYQGLDFLVKMHFGINFKEKFKVDRKNMAQADLAETLVYNAADSLYTLRLWYHQRRLLIEQGQLNACLAAMPRQPTVALMQHLGMPVNQATVTKLQKKLDNEIAVIEAEIEGLDVVKQYIKDKKEKNKEPFNPLGDDALVIFKDYLHRKEIQVEDNKKKHKKEPKQSKSKVRTAIVSEDGKQLRWSVDKNVLNEIDHPLAKLIISLRNKTKMKSTYVDEFELGKGELVWPDGSIHCNFNSTFTTTGRFSSDAPNMQNFPQRNDAWVREPIEAPDGHVIVAADYGQLEMCGAAMCSKDSYLIKVLWDDYDTHMFWAARLADIYPDCVGGDFSDKSIAKRFRSLVKNKLVFPAIYGATNGSIASYLDIDVCYIDTLMDEFWKTFSELRDWQSELIALYRKQGYTESPTGRRRYHPLTSNEAINSPIQCLASEIVVDAMCRLSYMAATENKWYLHPRLNIHDDLSFIVPEKKLVTSIETIYKTMLTPTFGDIVNVPLSVAVSVGKNWASMEEVDKFWSHKDL